METAKSCGDLLEFKEVDQKEKDKGILRRWFQNEKYVLVVWYDLEQHIVGFQICYTASDFGDDKAISWYNEKEFSHRKIDYGKFTNMSPVMDEDSGAIRKDLFEDFYQYCGKVEWEIMRFILDKEAAICGRAS